MSQLKFCRACQQHQEKRQLIESGGVSLSQLKLQLKRQQRYVDILIDKIVCNQNYNFVTKDKDKRQPIAQKTFTATIEISSLLKGEI